MKLQNILKISLKLGTKYPIFQELFLILKNSFSYSVTDSMAECLFLDLEDMFQ